MLNCTLTHTLVVLWDVLHIRDDVAKMAALKDGCKSVLNLRGLQSICTILVTWLVSAVSI